MQNDTVIFGERTIEIAFLPLLRQSPAVSHRSDVPLLQVTSPSRAVPEILADARRVVS